MRRRIVMTASQHSLLLKHFSRPDREQLAFLLAGVSQSPRHLDLLVRRIHLVHARELVGRGRRGLELGEEARREIFSAAAKSGDAVVEAHDHPGAGPRVTFSTSDNAGEAAFIPYVRGKLPGMPYGAMVWSERGLDARVWLPELTRPRPVDVVRVVAPQMLTLVPTSSRAKGTHPEETRRYDRQLRAFGPEGQARLSEIRVAIVGLGGIGSHVAQQLAYLGVRIFLLVDDDKVEASNLNRLIGAFPGDERAPKVHIARRVIRSILPEARVTALRASLMSTQALEALRGVDLIVGCTDTDGSRFVLNEFAKVYLLPYVDCGTGIEVEDGKIARLGGHVAVVLPDGPCLLCAQEIDRSIAQQELETAQERELRRQHGYVTGADGPEPSVISLNGVVASLAVGEVIALVTGWRSPVAYQTYHGDGRTRALPVRRVSRDPNCIVCHSKLGQGDAARIERYVRKGLPRDLPG